MFWQKTLGTSEPKVDYNNGTKTFTEFLKEYDDEVKFAQLGETIPEGSRSKIMYSIALKLLTR